MSALSVVEVPSSSASRSVLAPRPDHATGLDVRLVPVAAIRAHEEYAPSREQALSAQIAQDGILRHPLIVAEVAPGRYVLLDGTHRLEWLRCHGYAYAPVQV